MSSLLRGLVVFLMMFSTITYANDVNNDVTFTLKSDGAIVSTTNIGTFDLAGDTLKVNRGSMPAEFTDDRRYVGAYASYRLNTPVGHYVSSLQSISGYKLTLPVRLNSFLGKNVPTVTAAGRSCSAYGGTGYGDYHMRAAGKPYSLSSCETDLGFYPANSDLKVFEGSEIEFMFFEGEGISAFLKKQKLPPGTWTFAPVRYSFHNSQSATSINSPMNWLLNIKVVVEPSMAEVNMPSLLLMNVARSASGEFSGQGSVPVMVSGSLGRNLRVQTRSSGGGSLSKGAEQIPYNLVIQPQSGDTTRHNLINNGRVQPEVVIPLHGSIFDYMLRLDASFIAASNGLSSGRFNDNVTLIFSTTDVP